MSPKNVAVSVWARLKGLARERGEQAEYLLTRYALERLLYRLSRSPHADRFVLKGACLFELWTDTPHRATRDIDLWGHGRSDVDQMVETFREICATPVEDDGLVFAQDMVSGRVIKEDQEYEGLRVTTKARLGSAVTNVQIDIGFGDAITPDAEEVNYPTLLPLPAPVVRAYPMETVVAEKYQAMVQLGMANSRMKDFFDLYTMARLFKFNGEVLAAAIAATFQRRRTTVPSDAPTSLTDAFAADERKARQWTAFVKRTGLGELSLGEVIVALRAFLLPMSAGAASRGAFTGRWLPGGPWS